MSIVENGKDKQVLFVTRSFILNSENKILFVQRAKEDGWMPGLWEIPGGKYEDNDEIFEETGLSIKHRNDLAYIKSFPAIKEKYVGFTVVDVFDVGEVIGGDVVLSSEHQRYKWMSVDEALKYDLVPPIRRALRALAGSFNGSWVELNLD